MHVATGKADLPLVAVVCDGVSSSFYAAKAAELSVEAAPMLLVDHKPYQALGRHAEQLRALRESQQAKEPTQDYLPEALQSMMREVLREKHQRSYQTTMIAVRLSCEPDGIKARYLRCGDSALLVFNAAGEIVFPQSLTSMFSGRRTVTDVLPDHWERSEWDTIALDPGSRVLVASDGLIACFDSGEELLDWLTSFEHFEKDKSIHAMAQLHEKLLTRGGDDDISFVLLAQGA